VDLGRRRGVGLDWSCGLVHAVTLPAADWLARGPKLVRAAPVRAVKVADRKPFEVDPRTWCWRADHPEEYWDETRSAPWAWRAALSVERPPASASQWYARWDCSSERVALRLLARAALRWARGPHPERGLEALPPLPADRQGPESTCIPRYT
jgi:hypothetical protein